MRVLFVASGNSKYHNGLPAFVRSQADSLIESGLSVDFFLIKGTGLMGYLKNIVPLRNFLKKNKFDIIHAHYGFCGVVAAIAKRKEKLVISFMSECELIPDTDTLNPFFAFLMPKIHKTTGIYFAHHNIFKSRSLSLLAPGIKKSTVLPNGVDTDIFKPLPKKDCRVLLNIDDNVKIGLFVGDSTRLIKGFNIVEEAENIVKSQIDNFYVLHVNNIENHKLPVYYNAADFFILSSISEGSPNVIKEAMACSTPIVTTPVGDVKEIIGVTEGCIILKTWEPEEMAASFKNAINFDVKTKGRERIFEMGLSKQAVAKKLIDIYKSVM